MKGLTPRNEKEREFMKTFDDLCYGQSRYKVWDDFVNMAALSIVNAVDKKNFDVREDRFMRIRRAYSEKQFNGFAHLFSITALALEENPWQDFLGELYMRCDLGNDHAGQFFTPYHICEMMAKIIIPARVHLQDRRPEALAQVFPEMWLLPLQSPGGAHPMGRQPQMEQKHHCSGGL